MNLLPVIGLEIHLQLKTRTKMFCGCLAHEQASRPNQFVCPICMGHPGVLPVPNKQAVQWGVKMGLALGCKIAPFSKFDRKNYFYPDLPKGYQISQYDLPIAQEGRITIETPKDVVPQRTIGITRAHLEEDAAKSMHNDTSKSTYVDFNRAGTPLIEIVTEPDFTAPSQTKMFLQELRLIARTLGISDADMEKGHLRCDANISLREVDEQGLPLHSGLNPKTEIKNLNSFRHVERALEYEIKRHTKLWEAGTPPLSTTRGWDAQKQVTVEQRTKEGAEDYRFFPEPDIPPFALQKIAEAMRLDLPELPAARRERFVSEYALKKEDARTLCENPELADFVERVFSELASWLKDQTEGEEINQKQMAKLVAGWTINKLQGLLIEEGQTVQTMKVTPENFAEFLSLVATRKLSSGGAQNVLQIMLKDGTDPTHIMEDRRLGQVDDEGQIAEVVDRIVESHPDEVNRYRAGEEKLMTFFIGMVMKETQGTVDPGIAQNMLKVKLASKKTKHA